MQVQISMHSFFSKQGIITNILNLCWVRVFSWRPQNKRLSPVTPSMYIDLLLGR